MARRPPQPFPNGISGPGSHSAGFWREMDKLIIQDAGLEKFQQALQDVADGRTYITCETHMYTPSPRTMPTSGCADCWRAFYWTIFAMLGPEKGREWLDGLEAAIYHSVEAIEKGTWDFSVDDRPTITITKEDEPLVEITDKD